MLGGGNGISAYGAVEDTFLGDANGAVMPSFDDMYGNNDMFDWVRILSCFCARKLTLWLQKQSSLDQYIQSDCGSWKLFFSDTGL